MPRILRKVFGRMLIEFRGCGSNLNIPKYQQNICNNNGTFLNVSTYIVAIILIAKFEESLAMPTLKPNKVAKNIPNTETITVFKTATKRVLK